ncbi:pur operon repressor [Paramaledivibacter caminithermalis]|uniref:Purine operon repressor, PurR n=1 Tax=Paramaledivibacter caminithermalis (strain DSM 15212 / CIP 107654 / DViRD3) TaxID=1121301 RepID=A0A1M6QMS8_PARC5|nr:pur operon repressor [Paramaledivibacter caminithermalis]SHK21383.1 purine operon repressor, PurR [Paramaledivibacter caminithermalis DSM 15212]
MSKLKRNERVGALIKILCDNPNKIYTLNYFTNLFDSAKSTISEDLVIVKKLMKDLKLGRVETIAGASGGVRYVPYMNLQSTRETLSKICKILKDNSRIIPGSFLYMSDIIYNPIYVRKMGKIFATKFMDKKIDYVITVETKGIPIALMTANYLNIPLVIVRNDNKVTEGSTVSMNYVSGSTGKIRTMYVSKRAIRKGSNVLIIDDFMKGGGTAKGLSDLMKEFNATVIGIGVMISTKEPKEKLIDKYLPLMIFERGGNREEINIYPNEGLFV